MLREREQRHVTADGFLATISTLRRLGWYDAVRAAASPALGALMDQPPFTTALIPGTLLDETHRAVAATRGREGIRRVGLESMRGSLGDFLRRFIGATLVLQGRCAPGVFSSIDAIAASMSRGVAFRFEQTGESTGVLHVRLDGAPDPLAFAFWEGIAEYFGGLAKAPGIVGTTEAIEGGAGRMPVRW